MKRSADDRVRVPDEAPSPHTSDWKMDEDPMSMLERILGANPTGNNISIDLSHQDLNALNGLACHDKQALEGLMRTFDLLKPDEQNLLMKVFLSRMAHDQHNTLEQFLRGMLRRDFIQTLNSTGLRNISQYILSFLDAQTLNEAQLCSSVWCNTIDQGRLWRRLVFNKFKNDLSWQHLARRRRWVDLIDPTLSIPDSIYKKLYCNVVNDIKAIKWSWHNGQYILKKIHCNSQNSKGVYCLQYDFDRIVSGLRDNTIKIWKRSDYEVERILIGHTGSVLCLQYEKDILISGSSDTSVRVWDMLSGQCINTLLHHSEAVLHLRFENDIMVTSSKDRSIAVWNIVSPLDISIRRVLMGHRAAVNVVDFDIRFIVSASGDRTIKMWKTDSCDFYRTLIGHRRGIACLQYQGDLIVSGSSDNTIRIWNVLTGCCVRTLEGHEELVRCIRFNDKYIVSGAYDGKIKVWDLQAALNPIPTNEVCIRTLSHHTGRVFRLQFDQFQIVSSSHDDTILVWDFCTDEIKHPLCVEIRKILSKLHMSKHSENNQFQSIHTDQINN